MNVKESSRIVDAVTSVLYKIMDDKHMERVDLSMDTVLTGDLNLESIDYVILVEGLTDTFGFHIDFVDWFSSMDPSEIFGLSVGSIVKFIESQNRF